MTIKALIKEIEDEVTGAIAEYHVLDSFYVVKSSKYLTAAFATYVSQRAFDKGRQPVHRNISIQVNELPEDMSTLEDWIYNKAASEEQLVNGASPLTQAELVK